MASVQAREQWGSKLDFILSCLGYAVGLGNVWRFPYLCGENGGGVFLIPYGIMLIFAGFPTFYLELALGQYAGMTPHLLYRRMSPIFSGLGYAMIATSVYTSIYYNMIIAWALRYFVASFTTDLPFVGCAHDWNNLSCYDPMLHCNATGSHPYQVLGVCRDDTFVVPLNRTDVNSHKQFTDVHPLTPETVNDLITNDKGAYSESSSSQFNRYVLGAKTFDEPSGPPKWDLVLCLAVSWFCVFLALCKGVKSSGKVVYFTATFPYVVLFVLLIRGALLEGAVDGVVYFVTGMDNHRGADMAERCDNLTRCDVNCTQIPSYCISPFSKLKEAKVWNKAAQQIFFSLSLGGGGLTTLASYNQFDNNLLRDTLIVVIGNCATSIFAGFVIFPIIGYVAKISNKSVSQVAASGTALAFIVYPTGLATIDPPWLWSIMFFFMLILLGIDSQLVIVEVLVTAIIDQWPALRRTLYKVGVVASVCTVSFILGLVLTIPQGKYILAIFDNYAGGMSLVVLCLVEIIMVSWVYGYKRFIDDIRLMLGKAPNRFWRTLGYPVNAYWWVNWAFITPILLASILVFFVYDLLITGSRTKEAGHMLPVYMDILGWMMLLSCVLCVPIAAIGQVFNNVVKGKPLKPLLKPTAEWKPANDTVRQKADSMEMDTMKRISGNRIVPSNSTGHDLIDDGHSGVKIERF